MSEKIKLDKRCKDFIVQGVADSHLEYVRDKRSEFDAWASLSATFEKRGMLNKVMMKRALSNLKFVRGESSIEDHILRYDAAVRDIVAAGCKYDKEDLITNFWITLPKKDFDNLISIFETLQSELTFPHVKARCIEYEHRRVGEEASSACFKATQNFKKSFKKPVNSTPVSRKSLFSQASFAKF